MKKLFFLLLLIGSTFHMKAQDRDLVQFSGMVLTADSLRALPLVSIHIKNTNKGTYTDQGGFFSFVVRSGDTIVFSMIGSKTREHYIPGNLKSYRYSVIMTLTEDTFYLPETVIRGWPTLEEFNYYFVKARIPDQLTENARYNTRRLNPQPGTLPADPGINTAYYLRSQSQQNYYNGQLPPQRLFDPFAWSQFYQSWKRGDYRKK